LRLTANPADVVPHGHRTAIVVIFLIAIVAVSCLAGTYAFILSRQTSTTSGASPSQSLPVSAQLSVKVYNGSVLKASATENDDMVMNNFMNFLASWLTYEGTTSASSTFTMTDTTGTVDTLVGRDSSAIYTTCTWACEASSPPYAGGYIAVGTGTAVVARTDHKLTTQYQSLVTVTTPTYDPSTGNIVFGVGIIAGSAASISEVGFFENWYIGGFTFADFLMFHDTFSTIAVSAGNTISIQYTVQLGSTAYNNNLGILLAAIFANPLGTASSVKLNPTSGTSQTVSVYNLASGQGGYYIDIYPAPRADLGSGATGADSAIRVGTGSTSTCPNNSAAGFTQSRSATDLCNPVLSYQPVNSYTFSPYVAVTAVIPTPTATSFTEAGYYQSFGSGTYSFLLIRNTFTALAVPADSSITATYELSMS
jgi:hypothetical protein